MGIDARERSLRSWQNIRDRFQKLCEKGPEIDVVVVNYGEFPSVSQEDFESAYAAVLEWADKRLKEFCRKEAGSSELRSYDAVDSLGGRPTHRQCYYQSRVSVDDLLRCVDDAARLLFQLPPLISGVLWERHFTPKRMPRETLTFWSDAVLELAMRKIDGSPLSRSAKCFTWRTFSPTDAGIFPSTVIGLEFLNGEMSDEKVKTFLRRMRLPDPLWFWFAELKGFVSKSVYTVDWIMDAVGDDPDSGGKANETRTSKNDPVCKYIDVLRKKTPPVKWETIPRLIDNAFGEDMSVDAIQKAYSRWKRKLEAADQNRTI
ncbi:MAG: hypothetical protein WEB58_11375 [Planctomycetaceae bacterium]